MTPEMILFLLLDVTIKGTVLLGVVGLVGWVFAKHRPALRALLWGHVFVALLVLPVASLLLPELRLPILPSKLPTVERQQPVVDVGDHTWTTSVVEADLNNEARSFSKLDVDQETRIAPVVPVSKTTDWQMPAWSDIVLALYVFGLVFCLLRIGFGWWRVRVLRQAVHEFAGANVMVRLDRWCAQLGVKVGVDIGISDRVSVPTVIGFWRPLIVVPQKVAECGTDDDWDAILVHELAHVKRGDAFWNVLGLVVTALYWFHPGVYWVRRNLADTREYACDDWAVYNLGDSEGYATTLMEVTARTDRRLSQSLGLDMARTARVLHRVNRILNLNTQTLPEMGRVVSGAALCVMLMSAGLLGSLQPTAGSVDSGDRVVVNVENGAEAVAWLRQQLFLHDYVAGYREGAHLVERYPNEVALKAWYVLHLIYGGRAEQCQTVITTMPEGDVWTDFAQAFLGREDQKIDALHLSERALRVRPNDPDFVWMRAQVLWKASGQGAAIAFVDDHVDRIENPAELLAHKGNILSYQARNTKKRQGEIEKWDAAFQTFRQAQRVDPNNVSAHLRHAFFLSTLQRKAEAYPLIKRAAQLSPYATRIHRLYWQITLRVPDWSFAVKQAEVEADMEHFLNGRTHYPEALAAVAYTLDRDLNQKEKYREVSNRILSAFPNSPEAEWMLVGQYRALRSQLYVENFESDTERAVVQKKYKEALLAFVNRPNIQKRNLLGDAYRDLFHIVQMDSTAHPKDLLRVVQGMAQYEKINPHVAFYMGPIALAERTSYYREAEAIARQGFEAAIAWGERKRRGQDGSEEAYQHGVNSMTARVHGALGWIAFQEGRFEDVEEQLLKAYELSPILWSNLRHLGVFYTHLKEWDRATSFFVQGMTLLIADGPRDMEMGLQNLYQARYGHLDGFETYLAAIKKDVEAVQRKRIQADRIDRPHVGHSNVVSLGPPKSNPEDVPNTLSGFQFECLDGSIVSFRDLHGKVVVLDVGMRVNEHRLREMQRFYEQFSNRVDVVVVHVNLDARLQEVAQTGDYTFPLAMGHGFVPKAQINRYPTTWFLDRQGRIVYEAIGSRGQNEWLRTALWRTDALLNDPVTVN